ncbi:MAG TPA: CDP-alcohol phosphatidyltransferase family protein [Gemmatirosa sp.]|nr:CDP-alcohol phosphatidyltransferase family protein [Gemmatirosa sp.]
MSGLWEGIKTGYLRLIDPLVAWLVRLRVSPNVITTVGTLTYVIGGVIYATGHIRIAGWWLSLTAVFDVLDGKVARATGRATIFGAFYDSTLDRLADGAVLGGLAVFFARNSVLDGVPPWAGTPMVVVTLLGIVGAFLTSYTRARAESLGIDAKVGLMQRPERVVLLAAPQALFGLALEGYVLMLIVTLLMVTSWITAVQRMVYVYRVTLPIDRGETPAEVVPAALVSAPRGPGHPS